MKGTMRGESKLGCLISLLIVVAAGYTAWHWGHAQWNYETMKQEITDIVKFHAAERNLKKQAIINQIIEKSEEIGLDIYEEDIEIRVVKKELIIDVFWEVPIAFPGYTYFLQYNVKRSRPRSY